MPWVEGLGVSGLGLLNFRLNHVAVTAGALKSSDPAEIALAIRWQFFQGLL